MCIACAGSGFHDPDTADNPLLKNNWPGWAANYLDDDKVKIHIDKQKVSKPVWRAVKSTIKEIDSVTGIDIQRTKNPLRADITFEVRDSYENDPVTADYAGSAGLAFVDEGMAYATVLNRYMWTQPKVGKKGKPNPNKLELQPYSQRLIAHELLHTLGLSHPNGSGADPNFDASTTTMSYNNRSAWTGLTGLDVSALQEIWGLG